MKLPLGGHAEGRAFDQSYQTCINFLVEPPSQAGDDPHLIGTPGYAQIVDYSGTYSAQVRGILWCGETVAALTSVLYVVIGNRFYSYDITTNTWTDLNAAARLSNSTGPVSMAFNGGTNQDIVIATGAAVYSFRISSSTFGTAGAGVFANGANTVCFIDGYIIGDDKASPGQFRYSNIYAAGTGAGDWNAFNFATAEGSPDQLKAVLANRRELFLFGTRTTEVFFDTGDANQPFQRFQGGYMHVGIYAPMTAKVFDNSVVWLGHTEYGGIQVFRMGQGYTPQVLSPPWLDYQMQRYVLTDGYDTTNNVPTIFANVLQIGGHELYCLTFTATNVTPASVTWVYDATSKEWTRWRSGSTDTRHLLDCVCYLGGVDTVLAPARIGTLVAGINGQNSKLFRLGEDYYTDNTAAIYREKVLPTVRSERKKTRLTMLEVDCGPTERSEITSTTIVAEALQGATTVELTTVGATAIGDQIAITNSLTAYRHNALVTAVAGSNVTFANNPLPETIQAGDPAIVYTANKLTVTTRTDTSQFSVSANAVPQAAAPQSTSVSAGTNRFFKFGAAREWQVKIAVEGRAKATINAVNARFAGEDGPL